MKAKTAGIALMIIGIMMVVYTSFNFVTTEKAVDLGPIKIEKEKDHLLEWSPFIGIGIFLLGGLIVIVRKNP